MLKSLLREVDFDSPPFFRSPAHIQSIPCGERGDAAPSRGDFREKSREPTRNVPELPLDRRNPGECGSAVRFNVPVFRTNGAEPRSRRGTPPPNGGEPPPSRYGAVPVRRRLPPTGMGPYPARGDACPLRRDARTRWGEALPRKGRRVPRWGRGRPGSGRRSPFWFPGFPFGYRPKLQMSSARMASWPVLKRPSADITTPTQPWAWVSSRCQRSIMSQP